MSSTIDLYHFMIINLTIFLTFLKLVMLLEGILFVRISDNAYISTMDNLEIFPLTPRYLALFSVSFFAAGEFIGKTQTDRTQFNFQRRCPFFIAALHTLILVMRRRYQFTVDDFVILLVFVTSLSLYASLDLKLMSKPSKVSEATAEKGKKAQEEKQKVVFKNVILKNQGYREGNDEILYDNEGPVKKG